MPIIRPKITETTALGAAFAAGLSVGFWDSQDELAALWKEDKRWTPRMAQAEREHRVHFWKKAVALSFDWLENK
ncbi:Glycerol kinase [subsurface metagenome]